VSLKGSVSPSGRPSMARRCDESRSKMGDGARGARSVCCLLVQRHANQADIPHRRTTAAGHAHALYVIDLCMRLLVRAPS
jgi:hypothetical protein